MEPRVVYRYVAGVDNFDHLLRFDERDIVSDTNEVEYSIVNRLFSKRVLPSATDCCIDRHADQFDYRRSKPPQDEVPWGSDESPEPTLPPNRRYGMSSPGNWRRNISSIRPSGERWFPGGATYSRPPRT